MYTYDDWKAFKKKYKLKNSDIAEALGLAEQSVKNALSPSKELPTWSRAMLFVEKMQITTSGEPFNGQVMNGAATDAIGQHAQCGCVLEGRFFKRHKDCKLSRDNHTF